MSNFASGYIKYINHLEQINDGAINNPSRMINEIEESYHEHLKHIANNIVKNKNQVKICLLAGPSSSGKTTTTRLLCEYLKKLGKNAISISLDDFYLDNELSPIRADGTKDFETINSLDIKKIQECIENITSGRDFSVPVFDFNVGKPVSKTNYIHNDNDLIIFEGLHALNPFFTEMNDETKILKLYVSVKQPIKDANGDVMTPQEIRLVRRMVRDIQFRNTSPEKTLSMWDDVVNGEDKYIRPYKISADYTVNSVHIYEPCVFKNIAIPLIRKIEADSEFYKKARALEAKLMRFENISSDVVPENSVLREFIGNK